MRRIEVGPSETSPSPSVCFSWKLPLRAITSGQAFFQSAHSVDIGAINGYSAILKSYQPHFSSLVVHILALKEERFRSSLRKILGIFLIQPLVQLRLSPWTVRIIAPKEDRFPSSLKNILKFFLDQQKTIPVTVVLGRR